MPLAALNSLLLQAYLSNFAVYNKFKKRLDIKLNELEGSKKQLEASMSYEELKPHFEKAILAYRNKTTLPGFRKGKAPIDVIRKRFGDSIEYTSLEEIANEAFWDYMSKEKIDMIGRPSLTDIDYKPKEALNFKIEFEVMPEIKDLKYKGLELEKVIYDIDDSMVEDEIRYHRFRSAQHELDGQALDDEYVVTVDIQNLDDEGNVIIGESQNGVSVYLGNKQIYPEFKEAFKGIREGETKVIDSTNAEGNPKKVRVTCTKVEKLVYPEMNQEFFKTITRKEEINTEEEFRAEIKSALQKIYDDIGKRKLSNDIMSEILKQNDVIAPDVFVESTLQTIVNDHTAQLPGQKLPPDFDLESFKKERRPDAIRAARWFMIREKIAEIENISPEDSDYDKIATTEAERYGIPAEKLIQAFRNDENIKYRIIADKVIDFVEANAEIKEKVEKISAEPESEGAEKKIIT